MKKSLTTLLVFLYFISNSVAGPCNTIVSINCSTPVVFSVSSAAGDPQFPTGLGSCGTNSTTNGLEVIYKFKASITGVYEFKTTSTAANIIQYSYKSAGLPCDSSGWKCIGFTKIATSFGGILLNANDSIYILANASIQGAVQQTFRIECALPIPSVCDSIITISSGSFNPNFPAGFGNPNYPNAMGGNSACTVNTGIGGHEKMYLLKASKDGTYLFNSGNTPAAGNVVSFYYKDASLGCDSASFKCLGIADYYSNQLNNSLFLHAGDSIFLLLNNLSTASYNAPFQITIVPVYCDRIEEILCGKQYTFYTRTIDSSIVGYNNGMGSNCFQTAGRGGFATIYKLKAPVGGTYQLSTSAASNGVIEYFYKNAALGCDTSGWQCINYTAAAIPNLGSLNLTAGDSILLLVKAEDKLAVMQFQPFQFSCPASCPSPDTPIIVGNKPFTFCRGDSVTLSIAQPIPTFAKVSWYYREYNDTFNYYTSNTILDQHTLVVKNSGTVSFTISYCGYTKTSPVIQLAKIDTPLNINIYSTSPLTQCAINSPTFILKCSNPGSSPVHFSWKRNGVSIGTDSSALVTNLAGTYTLDVSNICGAKSSNSIVTTVKSAYTGPRPHLIYTGANPFCSTDTTVTLSVSQIPNAMFYKLFQLGSSISYATSTNGIFKAKDLYSASNNAYFVVITDSCGISINSDTLYGTHTKHFPISPFSISYTPQNTTLCNNKGGVTLYITTPNTFVTYDWQTNGVSQNIQSSGIKVNFTAVVTLSLSNTCGTVYSSNSVPITITTPPTTYETATICPNTSYDFHGQKLTAAGTYTKVYSFLGGRCDSTISLNLTLYPTPSKPVIAQNGNTLSINSTYNSYQWFFENNIISTDAQISATQNGYYKVKGIDANGCENISDSLYFFIDGIQDENNQHFSVSPNPVRDNLEVIGIESNINYTISITDMQGRVVMKNTTGKHIISVADLKNGLYLLHITLPHNQNIVKRFVKQAD